MNTNQLKAVRKMLGDEASFQMLVPGKFVFSLKDRHGVPFDFTFDKVINERGAMIEWPSLIEEARRCGWWDFQTLEALEHGLIDAMIPKSTRDEIIARFKMYVLQNPHPRMV